MNIPISIPLDNDGFMRRECPNCLKQFKWHDGPANEDAEHQPSASAYYCPFCGQPAGLDQWWTTEQVEYTRGMAAPAAMQLMDDELSKAFRGLNSKHVKITKKGSFDKPAEPDPMVEPDDMIILASPCHAWEPIKVPADTQAPVHCLVCGQAFAF
ncbi:hypothetical protein ES689_12195 [Frigoribacterium sp. ACAM 257]|uniref:hypothetical protein n=1 Tax=Frigoribacterium sp. ACAM 257 TaxID=2508998 RepID=UPI0011B975E7|nr:hypothetical protein [Frigoribacterium sp. ACAM 257]TWX37395.1 hypothetical protein ES689_12195 [Frigoribacterium sp. ACAM 257]